MIAPKGRNDDAVPAGMPGESRDNSFFGFRLIAATLVLVSHCFALKGLPEPELGTLSMGGIPVLLFFGVSGFLITQSWTRDPSLRRQIVKRVLRIYPPLVVVLVLSALLLGPLVTNLSVTEYLGRGMTWTYVRDNIALWANAYHLPGVFTDNPFPRTVNGSLWTLASEIRAYIMISILGVVGVLSRRSATSVVLVAFMFVISFGPGRTESILGNEFCMRAFCVGSLLFLWRDRVVWKGWIAVVVAGAYALLSLTPLTDWAAAIAVPYVAIVAAYGFPNVLRRVTRHGDFSYGTYLYAFPIAQLAVNRLPGISTFELIVVDLVLTYLLAFASWRLIESPALQLKGRLTKRRPSAASVRPDAAPDAPLVLVGSGSSGEAR